MTYLSLDKEKEIFIKEEAKEPLRETRKIIFDFDGVLAQTNQSYRQTIIEVVDYYFLEILGLEGEKGKLTTLKDIQKCKNTGLYNNDWRLSYTLIRYHLNLILYELEQRNLLKKFTKQFTNIRFSEIQSFIQKLKEVGDFLKNHRINCYTLIKLKDDNVVGLRLFLAQSNLENQKTFVTSIFRINPEVLKKKEMIIKTLIPYDLEKPDLIKRLFEEIYLGRDLFKKIYETQSFFKFDTSFLDKEEFIPTQKTLNLLSTHFGKFGIYSGRPRPQGMYILKKYDYLKYFDKNKSIFLGNLLNSEEKMKKLGKPNPTLFIQLIRKKIENGIRVIYVGDGIADAILVEKAKNEGFNNISFLGVMSSSEDSNNLFNQYIEHRADAILNDVNDIPYLFAILGVMT